jgi:hypothetical protein
MILEILLSPHGDPIPNAEGNLKIDKQLSELPRIKKDLCGSERYFIRVLGNT